jgi:hypothetical protein
MNPRLARLLTRMYPGSWRERYGAEFKELLETGRGGVCTVANVVLSGLHERIFPTPGLTPAQDTDLGRLHFLCARAPWAIFSLAPVSLLAGCYIASCLILRIGWQFSCREAIRLLAADRSTGWQISIFNSENIFMAARPFSCAGWL